MYSFILLPSKRKLNQPTKNKKMKKFILATALIITLGTFSSVAKANEAKMPEKEYFSNGEKIGVSKNYDFAKLPKDAIYTITTKYTFPKYNLHECVEFVDVYGNNKFFLIMSSEKVNLILEITNEGDVSVASRIKK